MSTSNKNNRDIQFQDEDIKKGAEPFYAAVHIDFRVLMRQCVQM
jgi:hypothetical protein